MVVHRHSGEFHVLLKRLGAQRCRERVDEYDVLILLIRNRSSDGLAEDCRFRIILGKGDNGVEILMATYWLQIFAGIDRFCAQKYQLVAESRFLYFSFFRAATCVAKGGYLG